MTHIDRRTFLKGVGVVGGTALGLSAFNLFAARADKNVIRYGLAASDIRRLDPMAGPNSTDKTVLEHIYRGLVRTKPGEVNAKKFEADLAESWEHSNDLKTWTFNLRKGVEFHDGYGELIADDVAFSLNRARTKKTSIYAKFYREFEDIKPVDKYTVRVTLNKPQSGLILLPKLIGWQAGMIMSRNAAKKLGDKIKNHPVGTGPFAFKEHISQERLVLVRNDNFYRGKPKIEQIDFRFLPDSSSRILAFKAGELDIIEMTREQRAIDQVKGPGVTIHSFGPSTVMKLHMDRRRKPLDDLRVRKAIAYAISRDQLVRFIGPDVAAPLYSIVPADFVGALQVPEKLKYNYNPEKSKQLLAEAGLPRGFTIDPVFISEKPMFRRAAEVIQNQLRQVSININLNVIAHPAWHRKNDEGSNPLVLRAAGRFPTANFLLEEFFAKGAKRNFSHFDGADPAIQQAKGGETDPEAQKKLWREAQVKILEELAAFPTHTIKTVYARKSNIDIGFDLKSDLCICVPLKWNAGVGM